MFRVSEKIDENWQEAERKLGGDLEMPTKKLLEGGKKDVGQVGKKIKLTHKNPNPITSYIKSIKSFIKSKVLCVFEELLLVYIYTYVVILWSGRKETL